MNERALKRISRSNARRFAYHGSEREGMNQTCPHCGGLHLGQRFDDCPYVKLVSDPTASQEQKRNAAEWLRLHREESKA